MIKYLLGNNGPGSGSGSHPIDNLRHTWSGLPTWGDSLFSLGMIGITLVLLGAGWLLFNLVTTEVDDNQQIVERSNVPFTLVRLGLFIGQGFALYPLATAKSDSPASDFAWLAGMGVVIVLVFNLALRPILSWALAKKYRHANDLVEIDQAHALVQAAFYVACGLIAWGALSGSAPSTGTGIAASLVFSLLGIVVLGMSYWAVGWVYNLHTPIRDENAAASAVLGGIVIGQGFVLRAAIAGDFTTWSSGLIGFAVLAIVGMMGLGLLLPLIDKLVRTKVNLHRVVTDELLNAAYALAVAIVVVGGVASGQLPLHR